eukprot:jgi/Mesvir1/16331/Mv02816-RA.1
MSNRDVFISVDSVEKMDDVEAGHAANTGAGTHFSMPGAISYGSNGATTHPDAGVRIDGKDDGDDGGNNSDASTSSSNQSDHKQPYYVARYEGINLDSGPSGANNTPKGVYRRNDRFRPRRLPSKFSAPRKLSGTLPESSEPPRRLASGLAAIDPAVLASAAPAPSTTTPRMGNLTRNSTWHSASGTDTIPDGPVNEELETAVEQNFMRSLWGQAAHVARKSVALEKKRPEQRFIGFLMRGRAQPNPRRLVSYNRANRKPPQAPAPTSLSPSDSTLSSVSSTEPLSPQWNSSGGRKSVSMLPARAKPALRTTVRQQTFSPTHTPVHSLTMPPDTTATLHIFGPQPVVVGGGGLESITGADVGSAKNGELKVLPEAPPGGHGVLLSYQEKPTTPLSKQKSQLESVAHGKGRSSFKSHMGGKPGPKKWEEPSDWEDGLIFGFRLDGSGGAKNITLADWITNPGTPEEPVWIHLNGMCAGAHKWLWEESGLERLVVEALTADDARPRSSSFNFGTLFVIRAVNTGGKPEDMVSVRLFLQPELLVTVRRRMLAAEEDVMEPLRRGRGPRTAAGVAVLLVEKCTLRMGPVVGEMEDLLDSIEHEWVEKGNSEALSNDLGNLRRRVVQMRRYIQPQRDALVDLLVEDSEAPEWHEWHRQRLREVTNSTTRMMEDLAVVWERSNVLHEEMKSLAAEHQGKRLYIMTMMTAVFLPLTFVTGLLGINVGGIPFRGGPTENNEGFWVVVWLCGSQHNGPLVWLPTQLGA